MPEQPDDRPPRCIPFIRDRRDSWPTGPALRLPERRSYDMAGWGWVIYPPRHAMTRKVGPEDGTVPELLDQARSPLHVRAQVLWDGGRASHWLGPEAAITLGRSEQCEITIDHGSVSRRHARLTGGNPPQIEDLGSSNGVRVRGNRIQPHERIAVFPGDVVELGSVVLVLQRPGLGLSRGAVASEPGPSPAVCSSTPGDEPQSPMEPVYRLLELLARTDIPVIILGETGVGKSVAASTIHGRSSRAAHPLVRLNCAALPEALLESELFGYEPGAFTGAARAKPGIIESGSGGTVLLDEVGEIPLSTQAKLLAVLENGEVLRLGSVRPRAIDVRFLAATNRDLDGALRSGAFRRDLYYRLNGISVTIPPLRERRDEIPGLARLFVEEACERLGRAPPLLSDAALARLRQYGWPGNLRELRNTMERAVTLCDTTTIRLDHLWLDPVPVVDPSGAGVTRQPTTGLLGGAADNRAATPAAATDAAPPPAATETLRAEMAELERRRIIETLEACGGNQTQAAKALGMSRRALITRIEQYDLPRPRKGKRR